MKLRDVDGWPPTLTDSQTFRVVATTPSLPAIFRRAAIFSIAGSDDPYLSIVVDYQGRTWHAALQDVPEEILRRIEATLKGRDGTPLADLGDLQLVELR